MPGADFLLTVAEISLVFVGFTAVVATFRQSREAWSPFQKLLVTMMIELGFAALFLSLLPFLLSYFGVSDEILWRVCNTLLGLFLIGYFTDYVVRRRPASARVETTVHPATLYSRLAINYSIGLAALLSAAGIIQIPGLGIYALGISWILVTGALTFLITVTVIDRSAA